jgi:hypothetical protein
MRFLFVHRALWLFLAVGCLFSSPGFAIDLDEDTCLPTWPRENAHDYVQDISNGWRPLELAYGRYRVNEVRNVRIIHEEFRKAGLSNAMAYAAIVNAMAESALNERALMTSPFRYKDRYYPRGTRAVGLFQLLPSVSGAGGPSGLAEGYKREFMGRRYAGTAWQAAKYGDTPDHQGRMYYNGQDPRINARRIIMEIERDGQHLVDADAKGASIATLTYIFARDIERPSVNVWKRRYQATKMFGLDIADRSHPNDLFPLEFEVPDPPWKPLPTSEQLNVEEPEPESTIALATMLPAGVFTLVLFGLGRGRRID